MCFLCLIPDLCSHKPWCRFTSTSLEVPMGKQATSEGHASQLLGLRRELFTLWDSHNTNNSNNQNRLISKQVQMAPYMGKDLQLLQAPWLG